MSYNLYLVIMSDSIFNPVGVIVTPTTMKQLSMLGKINQPFKAFQVVLKKSLSQKVRGEFSEHLDKSGSKLIYINREYDGSERYFLLIPAGISYDFFPKDDNIIFLL